MRSLVFLAAVLATAAVLAPTASAQAPTQDSVRFTASNEAGLLDIDVRSGPRGENPTGRVLFITIGTTIDTPPTCLAVYPPPAVGAGAFAVINIVDAGAVSTFQVTETPSNPGSGLLEAARTNRAPTDCSELISPQVSIFGQLVIVDAAPLPTSKDQCKNGGWRDFGIFKDQGDCVSFVATGGKNPPGNSP
jgi:hypothetical protein